MTDRWFVFIESNTTRTGRLFAETARELGCRPAMLRTSPDRYSYLPEERIEVRVVSGHAPELLRQRNDWVQDLLSYKRHTQDTEFQLRWNY